MRDQWMMSILGPGMGSSHIYTASDLLRIKRAIVANEIKIQGDVENEKAATKKG